MLYQIYLIPDYISINWLLTIIISFSKGVLIDFHFSFLFAISYFDFFILLMVFILHCVTVNVFLLIYYLIFFCFLLTCLFFTICEMILTEKMCISLQSKFCKKYKILVFEYKVELCSLLTQLIFGSNNEGVFHYILFTFIFTNGFTTIIKLT